MNKNGDRFTFNENPLYCILQINNDDSDEN